MFFACLVLVLSLDVGVLVVVVVGYIVHVIRQ